jgi:ABC-2 type transport system permease protein
VLDQDGTMQSREFIQSFIHSEYFDYLYAAHNQDEVDRLLDDGKVVFAVIIPPKFADQLVHGETAPVQVIVDGSNATLAPTSVSYIAAAISSYSGKLRADMMRKTGAHLYTPVDFRPRVYYNPELSTVKFMIPGLIGYVLMLTSVVATAMSIVREKERGTMEQLVVSSVTPFQLIVGKLLPYLFIAIASSVVLIAASFFVFGVAVLGNYIYLFISILLFLICSLAMGMWVSTISNTQLLAFQFSTLVSTLPAMMLSGFIFPIRSMPVPIQVLTNLTPVKFFISAIRAIMLKGVGPEAFIGDWGAMLLFAAIVLFFSVRRMKRQRLA